MSSESFFKREKTPPSKEQGDSEGAERKLDKIRKELEATLKHLEADPREKEDGLLNDKELKKFFPRWKEDFWKAKKEYAKIPQPKNAVEQTFIWNSGQAPIEGKIMNGFKQLGPIIMDRENLKELKARDVVPLMEKEAKSIIVVDRERDKELDKLCKWAGMLKHWKKDEEEKIFIIAKRVHETMGGALADEETVKKTGETSKKGKEIFLGDIKLGACHERALLFQVLAQEAEIKSSVQKTRWLGSHSYNPVSLKNDEILIVDTMYPPADKDKYFGELSYQEFKELGGFPPFGSKGLPLKIYHDEEGRFQGGRLGYNGLKELLK